MSAGTPARPLTSVASGPAWGLGASVPLSDLAAALGASESDLLRRVGEGTLHRLPGGRIGVSRDAAGREIRLASPTLRSGPMTIAFVNLKGGVGKTTLLLQLASRAWQFGLSVCVLDLDPQASATLALAGELNDGGSVFLDLWQDPDGLMDSALLNIAPGFQLVPSSLDNTLLDGQLAHPSQQKRAVRRVGERILSGGVDWLLVDCPPTLGTAVISALCATDEVIVPVGADAFARKGLQLTLGELEAICETFALAKPRVRVLFNRHDRRERLHDQALQAFRRDHPQELMSTVMRTTSQYARALAERRSVFALPSRSPATKDVDSCLRELLGLNGVLEWVP